MRNSFRMVPTRLLADEALLRSSGGGGPSRNGFFIRPIGGGADDAPRVQTVLAIAAVLGVSVTMLGGVWTFATPVVYPSNAILYGNTDTLVTMTMSPTGTQSNDAFRAFAATAPNPGLDAGTLTSNAVVGSNVVHATLANKPAIGASYEIAQGNSAQIYQVKAISAGAAPWAITLDRAVTMPFTTGGGATFVLVLSFPQNIRIFGNGMRITGTGDRAIEFGAAVGCEVHDVHYDTSGGILSDTGMSFDVGGRNNKFVDCSVDMTGGVGTQIGIMLEGNEHSCLINCVGSNCVNIGAQIIDCANSWMDGCDGTECVGGTGLGIGGSSLGSFDCQAINSRGSYSASGIVVGLSARTMVRGCAALYNTGNGITGITGAASPSFDQCTSESNDVGVLLNGGVTDAAFTLLDLSGNTATTVISAVDVSIDGLTAIITTSQSPAFNVFGPMTRISNFKVRASGGATNVFQPGGAQLIMENGQIELNFAGDIGIFINGNPATVVRADALRIFGSGGGTTGVLLNTAGVTFRQGSSCDFTGTGAGVTPAGGTFPNRFIQALAGAATTVVPWPDLKSTDNIQLQIQLKAGTLEAPYQITPTPGTGFTITPLGGAPALDTSTLEVCIL